MTYDNKVSWEEQQQYTYENSAEARRVTPIGSSGSSLTYTDSHTNQDFLKVVSPAHHCTGNSSTTPLGAGAEFTGTWHYVNGYAEIIVACYANVASATNGLIIEHSNDGITVHDTDSFNVYAATGSPFRIVPGFDYIRVRYINGATPQTTFVLSTTFRYNMTAGSTHRADETIRDSSDGPLSISVLKLRTAQNNWIAANATSGGNMKVAIDEFNGDAVGYFNPVAGYSINDIDESGAPVSYFGFERADGAWYILKEDATTSTNPTYRYATGTSGYTTAWTGRAAQSYGYFGDKF